MTDQTPKPAFIDDLHSPEIFASDASGFFISEGVVRFTFESIRASHRDNPDTPSRVVVARVAMPVPGAQRLLIGLYDFLRKNKLDPVPATPEKDQLQ
jgi:hypothetical protein